MSKATMEVEGILTVHSYSDEYPSKEDLLFAVEKVPDGAKITSLDINHYSTKSDKPDVKIMIKYKVEGSVSTQINFPYQAYRGFEGSEEIHERSYN